MRRFTIPTSSTITDLHNELASRYGGSSFTVKWKDDEGDLISLATNDDLAEAAAVSSTTLRLFVSHNGDDKQEQVSKNNVHSAVHDLAASLELEVPPSMLNTIANKLQAVAPFA